jgi:Flp pilus assembly protein TadD
MLYESLLDLDGYQSPQEDPVKLLRTGLTMMKKGRSSDAIPILERAASVAPDDEIIKSHLGLAMAESRREGRKGLALCEQAAQLNPYRSDILHNLGKAYLASGRRGMAFSLLHEATQLDPRDKKIRNDLHAMGRRRSPVFTWLPRDHAANVIAGRVLARIGVR